MEPRVIHLPHGPPRIMPAGIVVHCMGERIQTKAGVVPAVELLRQEGLSAHALIEPDGTVVRCRDDTEGAYHARGWNSTTFGVEVLVPGVHTVDTLAARTREAWVSPMQYTALRGLVTQWKLKFPSIKEIWRHSDLDPVNRWFDPGAGFPWAELLRETWGVR